MKPTEVIFLFGAMCMSPVEQLPNETVVGQVPCAELVFAPIANPYKITQEPNVVSASAPKATAKKSKPRKKWKKRKRR